MQTAEPPLASLAQHVAKPLSAGLMPDRAAWALAAEFKYSIGTGKGLHACLDFGAEPQLSSEIVWQ